MNKQGDEPIFQVTQAQIAEQASYKDKKMKLNVKINETELNSFKALKHLDTLNTDQSLIKMNSFSSINQALAPENQHPSF